MSNATNITYLNQSQIDKKKWDQCIESATNGLIYGYSFYLDHMSKHWDALVFKDYEAVMPLTWNKKFGLYYLYQPFLTAQLGVFGNNISVELTDQFIQAIPARFRYIDIALNKTNASGKFTELINYRNNYVIDLNKSYQELFNNYNENIQRNIKKANQQGCTFKKNIAVENIIELAVLQMKINNHSSKENIERFKYVYNELLTRNMTTTYGVFSPEEKLLASCVFFFSNNKAYYILVGNHPDGKTKGASHLLIDGFIKEFAGQKIALDFEGSDIPNLAHYYNSFGAKKEVYPTLKINRLPFYLRWLKS